MHEALELYQAHYGHPPTVTVRAPGRVELLGNHTDYNQGYVMALAVDKVMHLAAAPRPDDRIELVSSAFPAPARFHLSDLAKDPAAPWANYVKGLLRQLRDRGARLRGFNAALHGTVPVGSGLSSSAALLVATALALRQMTPYQPRDDGAVEPLDRVPGVPVPPLTAAGQLALAKICQAAENQFVGVNCGLLDYLSSLFGRAGHAVAIDCLELTVDWVPLSAALAVVVCHSGVKHALVAGEYNDRRRHCEAAARTLGVASLRHVDRARLEAGRATLAERDYQCALHVVGENERVQEGRRVLQAHDLARFGQLLYASHASSRDHFLNSCPELDVLVELAHAHPHCLGARLSGGGFGGTTLNLVPRPQAEAFRQYLIEGYAQRTGRQAEAWQCEVVEGAG